MSDYDLRLRAGDATHQHYKGGLYRLLGPVRDADNGGPVFSLVDGGERVVYEHCYPHKRELWMRNADEFHGSVSVVDRGDGQPGEVPRFRRIA